jgi:hypothetical protein
MMLERDALDKGIDALHASDFYRPTHQEVFDALVAMSDRDEPIDLVTLQEELRRRCKLDDCGGTEYLMSLVNSVPTAANVEYYAKIVKQKSVLRNLISAGTQIIGLATNEEEEIAGTTERAEQILAAALGHNADPTNLLKLEELLCGPVKPVEWTVSHLIPRQGITLVTGDPGVGKSWAVIGLAYSVVGGIAFLDHYAVQQCPVLIYDTEHGEEELQRRTRRVYEGFVYEDRNFPCTAPLYVAPESFKLNTSADFKRQARVIAQYEIGLVICDPLVHCLPDGADENSSRDVAGFFEKVRKLQAQVNCSFVFVHHTRKQSANASNTPSQMIRGSSAINGILDSHIALRSLKNGPILVEHAKSRKGPEVPDFSIVIADHGTATTIQYGGESDEVSDQRSVALHAIARMLTDNKGPLLREIILQHGKQEGLSKATIVRVLGEAVDSGDLVRFLDGKRAKFDLPVGQQQWWSKDPGDQ